MADSIWFYLGRVRGGRVLKLLCRISLEPDSCVRRTEDLFVKRGMKGIVTAKFLPGLSVVMPPLAGMFKIKFRLFLAFDAAKGSWTALTWRNPNDQQDYTVRFDSTLTTELFMAGLHRAGFPVALARRDRGIEQMNLGVARPDTAIRREQV